MSRRNPSDVEVQVEAVGSCLAAETGRDDGGWGGAALAGCLYTPRLAMRPGVAMCVVGLKTCREQGRQGRAESKAMQALDRCRAG